MDPNTVVRRGHSNVFSASLLGRRPQYIMENLGVRMMTMMRLMITMMVVILLIMVAVIFLKIKMMMMILMIAQVVYITLEGTALATRFLQAGYEVHRYMHSAVKCLHYATTGLSLSEAVLGRWWD